ncbi:MAG: ribosome small subunit-dependent GTPase A, partial [Bacilli bacterium]|nr:ribosome small subunit-dependent GTPase A [Bacilli bacterium]
MLKGKIIKNISNLYTVLSDNKQYDCTPRGVFRHQKMTPLVGDQVIIDEENKQITEIYPRKNELSRPSVANV